MTDLEKMKIEFLDIFADLFTTAYYRQKRELQIKQEAVKQCEDLEHSLKEAKERSEAATLAAEKAKEAETKVPVLRRSLTLGASNKIKESVLSIPSKLQRSGS
jgi:hypothetical protein